MFSESREIFRIFWARRFSIFGYLFPIYQKTFQWPLRCFPIPTNFRSSASFFRFFRDPPGDFWSQRNFLSSASFFRFFRGPREAFGFPQDFMGQAEIFLSPASISLFLRRSVALYISVFWLPREIIGFLGPSEHCLPLARF